MRGLDAVALAHFGGPDADHLAGAYRLQDRRLLRGQLKGVAVATGDDRRAAMPLFLMILTADEVAYYKNGGILQYVLRNLVAA